MNNKVVNKKKGLIVLLVLAGMAVIIWLMGAVLIHDDPLQPAEAIVVLSGGEMDRLPEAARLYNEGYAYRFIITDTGLLSSDPNVPMVTLYINRLIELGVPADAITVVGNAVNSTRDEAEAVAQQMSYFGWTSCIVVTDPYHTLRTSWIFHQVLGRAGVNSIIHSVPGHWYTRLTWWTHPEGWVYMGEEYVKLAANLLGIRR
jgi:uncharacterized SAM-binding protein YcdF (DUF218 family)